MFALAARRAIVVPLTPLPRDIPEARCATAGATRSAIFAAMLAAEGMSGPNEPFDGKRGLWEQAVGKPVEIPAQLIEVDSFKAMIKAKQAKRKTEQESDKIPVAGD